jgi:hypothetical protein
VEALRTDVVTMIDVRFGSHPPPVTGGTLTDLRGFDAGSEMTFAAAIDEGSNWIFYGDGYADERQRRQGAAAVHTWAADGRGAKREARLLVHSASGLGVVSIWDVKRAVGVDPIAAKAESTRDQQRLATMLQSLGCQWDLVGRIYTFVAVQVPTEDLDDFVPAHAVDIGRLFTGDHEDEAPTRLARYVDTNISGRRFERLYLRWTDALAVYDSTRDDVEVAMMRAVRVAETCILMRRLLRDVAYELEQVASRVNVWTLPLVAGPWRRLEYLRRVVANAELANSVAPAVHSIEGEHLLRQGFEAFGIPLLLSQVRQAQGELERRLEWQRLRWLALAALLAFVLNFVVGFVV